MSWSLAGNLVSRSDSIKEAYPGTVIYSLGDESHQAGQSDHNRDSRNIVHALDAMTYEDTSKGYDIVGWCLTDPADLEYVIFNGQIWSRDNGWDPAPYHGSNPHEDHVHVSGKHGSTGWSEATGTGYDTAAEAARPAGMNGEDMTPEQAKQLSDVAWAIGRGAQDPTRDEAAGQAFLYWTDTVNNTLQSIVDNVAALAAAQGVPFTIRPGSMPPSDRRDRPST